MAAEEILGISGQMDISDIQASLDKLCDGLNRVGVDTDALSQRMTKALNDIAQSDGDLASKTQQAMNVLKSVMDEATKGMRQVPEMIDTANKKVETIEGTIGKLNDELAKTDKTSNAFSSITKQLEAQKQSLQLAKEDVTDLTNSYANVKTVLAEVGGAYEALNAFSTTSSTANGAQTVTNVAVGASATAAATATTAEAAAHTANAAAALGNADAESQNAQATQQLTAALQEYMSVASGRAEVERMQSESAKELKSDMKMYEETINDIQTTLATSDFGGKIEDATKRIEYQKHIIEQYKEALSNLSEEGKSSDTATYYNENVEVAKKKIEELQAKINEWQHEQQRLNNDLQEYNTLLDAAKKIQAGENLTGGFRKATEEAKNTAKETENIGKEAEKAGDKANGIFDKLKGFVTKGFNLDNVLSLVFSPKGATLAGITAVAAGVKNISEICQQLEESLIPLKAYVDGGTLEELRQQFVALEYDSSHSAEEMAAGATRWVKYFEGIRGNADAISDLTKSSNDFATVLGTTTEKAADYQLKIAGAYHQTALEAKENSTVIINATKNGTAKYEEMAQALAQTANRAQNAGVSFKELAAATTYGTSAFGSASEAANAYVMMMTRLSTQSKSEYNPTVVGATKALQNLAKSHEMNATLTSLLGKRQASLAKVFVQGAANIKQMQGGLDDEASAAKTLAGAESKLEEQEKRLANAKRALAHEVNMNLTPAYINFLESCSGFVRGIGNVSTAIKNSLKTAFQWINTVDNKIKDSTIYKLFGTSTKELQQASSKGGDKRFKLNLDKEMNQYDESSFWDRNFNKWGINVKDYNDKRRKRIQDSLARIYQDNLKKYGTHSPGKAYLATLNAYNHNSEFDNNRGLFTGKQIQNYVANMMRTTRTESQSRTKGVPLQIGDQNEIKDTKGDNKQKQLEQQQRQYRETEAEQQAKELAKAEKTKWDLYLAEKEAGIARLESASEKEAARHKLDYEKQKHAIEEEQKSMLSQNVTAAKQAYDKNPNNKKREGFYASGLDKRVTLTDDQKALIQAKYDALDAQEKAYDLEQLKQKTQSLYDYLKEYGTFKERQFAIAREYDAKIQEAERQGDTYKAMSLREEKGKQVGGVQASEIESRIDYTKIFSDFGIILKDQMDDILKSMKAFSRTDAFKAKPINEQKDFLSRMNELSNQYGTSTWKDINFTQLGRFIDDYNEKLKKRNEAEAKLNESSERLAEAQEEYEKAMRGGDMNAQATARGRLSGARAENDTARNDLQISESDLAAANNNVTDTARKLSGTLTSLDTLLQGMKSGSISSVWNSFVDFDKKINGGKATQAVTDTIGKVLGKAFEGKSDLVSMIIEAILSLLDTIAEQGLGGIVGGFIDSVLSAINGLLDNILSGKFIEQIGGALINGIGGILDNVVGKLGSVLSLGALSSKGPSAWFQNSNAEEVEKAINNLTDRNKSLQQSIDDLNDTMKNSSGAKSVESYKEAYKLQEEQNENYKKIAQEQANYHGSHHSWNYYWNGFSDDQTQWIKDHVKSDFNGDLWSLSPEELKQIRGGNIDIWDTIRNTGKGGYGNSVADKLSDYIDQADKLQELTDQINESLTQVSFSSMKDDFFSNLMDMEKDAQDFANDFATMMQKSVMRYGLEQLLNTDLKKLYEKWGAKMQEGNLTKVDIDNLKSEYDDIVSKGLEQRDYWAEITGYKESQSQQSATGKAIEAITADQASSLIGIGYGVLSAVEVGNETRKAIQVDISSLRAFSEQTANNISEMRDIQYQGLEQLEAINKNTYNLFAMKDDLASLNKIAKDYWR